MAAVKKAFKTPLAELEYVQVSGQGKLRYDPNNILDKDDAASYQYVATAVLSKDQADEVKKEILTFWKDNKPAGATKMKYDLVKPQMVKVLDAHGNEQETDEGDILKKETGKYLIQAKTITQWQDGKPNNVKILRANGSPLNLGDKQIGNESIGVLHGTLVVNAFKGNEGVNFYLNAVQLKKFKPYEGAEDVAADDLGDDEGMDGIDIDTAEELPDV